MCNFVLPAEKKLPGNCRGDRLHDDAGKKLYTEREAKPEDPDRIQIENKMTCFTYIIYSLNLIELSHA